MNPPPHEFPLFLQLGDAFVENWQGVPFKWDGRTRAGVDCWGLAVQFFAAVHARKLPDWRRRDNGRGWIARTISGEAKSHWAALSEPRNGCLCLARLGQSPHHFGIYWRASILHASEPQGVILQRMAEFSSIYPEFSFGEYVP